MDYDSRTFLFLLAFAGAVVAAFVAARGRRIWVLVALAALWLADLALVSQGWRDVDGFVDCRDACSPGQRAAGIVLLWTPVLFVALLLALVAVAARRRIASRPP